MHEPKGSTTSKSKEKVSVPMVNTKMLEIKEKAAISEEMSKSDTDEN